MSTLGGARLATKPSVYLPSQSIPTARPTSRHVWHDEALHEGEVANQGEVGKGAVKQGGKD